MILNSNTLPKLSSVWQAEKGAESRLLESVKTKSSLALILESSGALRIQFFDDADRHVSANNAVLCKFNEEIILERNGDIEFAEKGPLYPFVHTTVNQQLADRLKPIIGVRKLKKVASSEVRVQSFALRDKEQKARIRVFHFSVDDCRWLALIRMRGYEKDYKKYCVALKLSEWRQIKNSLLSALFASCEYSTPMVNRPLAVTFTGDTATGEAIKEMANIQLSHAQSNEPGFLEDPDDSEFLHEYRVSLRKLRSVVSLLKDAFPNDLYRLLKKRLSRLMTPTNQLRDLDVYLLQKKELMAMLPDSLSGGLPKMFEDFEQHQKRAIKSLKTRFRSKSYQREMLAIKDCFANLRINELTETANRPVRIVVSELIFKRYRKVLRTGRKIHKETPDERVHDLRLECKKLRYLLELFGHLYPASVIRKTVKELRRLQTVLGDFNDFSVQQCSLHRYLKTASKSQALQVAVGALIMTLSQKQQEARSKVEASFTNFDRPKLSNWISALVNQDMQEATL